MDEKILIRSERYDVLKILKAFVIVCFIATVIWSICAIFARIEDYNWELERHTLEYVQRRYGSNAFSYAISRFLSYNFGFCLIPTGGGVVISLLIYAWMHSYELAVTDKRVYGKIAFGKRVDLPVDSISATATIMMFKGVAVATSSGKISFLLIKNSNEIYEILNQLLIERQSEKENEHTNHIKAKLDVTEQLKKYKDLLDSEIITQEEFDAKKKELLGL